MRLLKPSWVNHGGKPIFSVDIHPDGSRLATGGQGEDSGKVAIWNMGPIKDEREEKDENIPKLLCQMDNHLACVNCVRWSSSGKYLASAGDDKLVMVWQISNYAGGTSVFGSGKQNVEQWRPASTLRGHTGDILDLSWSGNDAWLATCSVDNTVIVWNAEKFPEQIVMLKGHKGLVKGVTWDPVGKYLASQSDDRSVRIWRTKDWQEESVITEPFQECGGTTHVLRLNWSPDGHYIVSAHAMNNSGPVAQIIERDGWKCTLDFVGHRKAITSVRFNPNIFSKKSKKSSEKVQQYTCCAIGSRDKSLSVWLTSLKRPLVVLHDLFTNSILDITWGQNGMELVAGSCDGSIAYVDFSPEEIGVALSQKEMNMFLEKIYGRCLTAKTQGNSANQIIESTALLKLQQQQKQKQEDEKKQQLLQSKQETPEKMDTSGSRSSLMNGLDGPFKPRDKQIETKTPDGRRRITPIFLCPQPDVTGSVIPAPYSAVSNSSIKFTTSKDTSKIRVEKQNIVTRPGLASPSPKSNQTASMSSPPAGSTPKSSSEATPKSSLRAESPKPINASIQPMAALTPVKESTEKHEKVKSKTLVSTPERPEKDRVKDKMKGVKRKHDGVHGERLERRGRPRKVDKERQLAAQMSSVPSTPQTHIEKETIRYVATSSDLKLPTPSVEKSFTKNIQGRTTDEKSSMLEVTNDIPLGTHKVHRIQLVRDGVREWEQVHTARVLAVEGSREVICAGCEDGSVHVFTACGRRLVPQLVLNSRVSRLSVNGHYVMAISQKGSVYVWNMQSKSAVIRDVNLSAIMSGEDNITRASMTKDGVPMVTLSTHKSYTFSPDMACWTLLYNKDDPLQHCSDHHSYTPATSILRTPGPLASLQPLQDRLGSLAGRVLNSGHHLQQTATISHLESQLMACMSLQSGSEYKFWLHTYIRYIVKEGLETKLREVCDELLGPIYKSKRKSSWDTYVLGMDKRDLLQEILPLIGKNLSLQRLFTEYQEQLDTIDR